MSALRQQLVDSIAQCEPAVTIKAWRVYESGEAGPVKLPASIEAPTQAAEHAGVHHKEKVLVLISDAAKRPERRNLLQTYAIKKRSAPRWVRGPDGRSVREDVFYADLLAEFYVPGGFSPIEPGNVMRDPIGCDRTLVQS